MHFSIASEQSFLAAATLEWFTSARHFDILTTSLQSTSEIPLQLIPFYSHYTGQPAGTPVNNWRILLEQSFTACMPLLMATSTFALGRRR